MTDLLTPIDRFLAAERDATAVGRFARWHEAWEDTAGAAALALPRYRELVPLERPGPGQQYAFEVDLDVCTGCKACVTACHSMNGLDEAESWRSVGQLVGTRPDEPFHQHVTAACHHCVEPACLAGCPVDAYSKDASTGIVHHLDDQCIGCRYCTLMCPYEVPRFSDRLGIVRKCDLCSGRLAAGEPPACAQACPNGAIRVVLVDQAVTVAEAAASVLVPGAPDSHITVPTTVYRSERSVIAASRDADHGTVNPAHDHPPLAVMLVLTQLSVGAFVVDLAFRLLGWSVASTTPSTAVLTLGSGLLALAASVLHLGRPRYAFRAVIGLRHSWLSREILAFGGFATVAAAHAASLWRDPGDGSSLTLVLGIAVAVLGAAGVACSVMVYAVTRRTWWRASLTGAKFGLSALLSGSATLFSGSMVAAAAVQEPGVLIGHGRTLALLTLGATLAKLAVEAEVLRNLRPGSPEDLARTARLLVGVLRPLALRRVVAGVGGGVLLPLLVMFMAAAPAPPLAAAATFASLGTVLVVIGELLERSAFFRAVAAPRMPGAPS